MSWVVSEASSRVDATASLVRSVETLRFCTGKRGEALRRLGIHTVRDLLYHLPRRYLDFTEVTPIGLSDVGANVTCVGRIEEVKLKTPRPNLPIVEVAVADETGLIIASFFRKPWLKDALHAGEWIALSGKVTFSYGFKRMSAPFHEVLGSDGSGGANYARVLPVHPVGDGISASWMRRIVSCALGDAADVVDPIPAELLSGLGLMGLTRALRCVHFPVSLEEAEQARRRLAFDELLTLQLTLLCRQRLELSQVRAYRHVVDGPHLGRLLSALPFSLTGEQRGALDEILSDMASPRVMNRLLLGDVGTGKTAVACAAIAACADTGTQAAMMAPTSVLARQYADKLKGPLDAAGISWALVLGATPARERQEIAKGVAAGTICCVFGTTALLSEDISFRRLSLVVIDEQHRFGVTERLGLRGKGEGADLLAMTATPIPRTLALTAYGDLSSSRIRERPNAGAGVSTKVLAPENVDIAYGAIRDAVATGHAAYVICPLVDEQDEGEALDDVPEASRAETKRLHAATTVARELARGPLRGIEVGLLTGRMSEKDKALAMQSFHDLKTPVLVATTVVEVGVDVPAATVMLVLDADRFGLATLHQLRGRIGRGHEAGQAYLVCAAKKGTPARERLQALEATSDGFELAELDLKLRREGEVLGYRQHGGVTLSVCDLAADADLVEAAHEAALAIADADPELAERDHQLLAVECVARYGAYFEEMERS